MPAREELMQAASRSRLQQGEIETWRGRVARRQFCGDRSAKKKVSVVHPGKIRGETDGPLNILEHMYFLVEIHVRLKK
jgi:hypothetical protein